MQLLIFLLSPVLSLPFVFEGIKNRNKCSFVLISFFLGLFAYCTLPAQDLFRHFEQYDRFLTYDLKDISDLDFSLNGIEVYIFCIMGKLGLHFDYFRLTTLFVGFFLLCKIFRWKMNNSSNSYTPQEYFTRFIILFLFFDLFYTVMGLRYGFALCLYMYGVFLLLDKQKVFFSVLFFVMAYLFHGSFLFLVPASFVLYYLRISRRNMIFLLVVAFVAMTYFFASYTDLLGARADWYGNSSGVSSYSKMTFYGLIGFFGPKICALPFAYILIKNNINESKWRRMAMAWLVLSLICISNAVFFYRIWWVFSSMGIFLIIDFEDFGPKFNHKTITTIKNVGILFLMFNVIPYHYIFFVSDYYRLFEPVPLIFNHNYEINEILQKYPYIGDFIRKN